jgi:hypothetical protein
MWQEVFYNATLGALARCTLLPFLPRFNVSFFHKLIITDERQPRTDAGTQSQEVSEAAF